MKLSKNFLNSWRILLASVLIISFFQTTPVYASGADLHVEKSLVGSTNFTQGETGRTYTIVVKNWGTIASSGQITVTDTLPVGLTATAINGGTYWNCVLATLTCTTNNSINWDDGIVTNESDPITLTVNVAVNAAADVDPHILTNFVNVSGGGDSDPEGNEFELQTTVIQKPDLIVTGYELRNEANNAVIAPADINANEAFHIRISVKNQGGADAGIFYPGVFLDGKPNYGPDNDDYPFGQITYFNDFKIIYGSDGCLAYDPEENLDPMGSTCNSVRGNYTIYHFPPSLPAGASDTVDVYIGYTEAEFPSEDYDAVDVRTGLPAGAYQIYLYADPSGTVEESIEDNNAYVPITLNIGSTISVTIGNTEMGTYHLSPSESKRVNYAGVDSGPVVVEASDSTKIIAALRDAYFVGGQLESFVQLMGLPQESLSTTYYFPAYNNVTLDGQLRFGNVGNAPTTVTVTIAGVERGTYPLNPGEAKRVNYLGLDTGPVVVQSSGEPIIAALRDAYFVDGRLESFAQLMGLPAENLSTKYYFPAYNNVTLDGQLRFGNVGDDPTTVTVTIAGVVRGTYNLNPSQAVRVNYPLDAGPVVVESSGEPITAALRDAYFVDGKLVSFVQLMGLPQEQLSTKYNFPAYNNVTLDGQLRFGNVGNAPTTVTVMIAGIERGTYNLNPSQALRVNYVGLDTGPVVIESSDSIPIIAALRDAYFVNGKVESFAQLMGLPQELLSSAYFFPAYNNVTLDGQLRFGVP